MTTHVRERELIETVAAGIAHEVRNPLNALEINLRILEQELTELVPDQKQHVFEVVRSLSREVRSLDDFVTSFLRYARPPRPRIEQVQVRALLSDLALFIRPECAKHGVELVLSITRGPAIAPLDSFQMKQAVLNLVLNGVQASARGGRVEIATSGSDEDLEVSIRDWGEGIAPEAMHRIFDAFFTTREGGTGLGLPIARKIAEEHGGTLEIASQQGSGTTATIRIPLRGK